MASRKEQKEALRRERMEREQREAQAAARKRLIGIVVAAVLVLGIAVALAVVVFAGDDDGGGDGGGGSDESASISYPDGGELPEQREADLEKAIDAARCEEETHEAAGAGDHVEEPVNYETEPPALGPHHPVPEEDRAFETAPSTERLVHSLEHGRVIVWVKPDAPEELRAQLKAFWDEDPYHVVIVPRRELKEQIAATAWVGENTGHILRCAEPNDQTWDALRAFKEQYRDKAPEFVP